MNNRLDVHISINSSAIRAKFRNLRPNVTLRIGARFAYPPPPCTKNKLFGGRERLAKVHRIGDTKHDDR